MKKNKMKKMRKMDRVKKKSTDMKNVQRRCGR